MLLRIRHHENRLWYLCDICRDAKIVNRKSTEKHKKKHGESPVYIEIFVHEYNCVFIEFTFLLHFVFLFLEMLPLVFKTGDLIFPRYKRRLCCHRFSPYRPALDAVQPAQIFQQNTIKYAPDGCPIAPLPHCSAATLDRAHSILPIHQPAKPLLLRQ